MTQKYNVKGDEHVTEAVNKLQQEVRQIYRQMKVWTFVICGVGGHFEAVSVQLY